MPPTLTDVLSMAFQLSRSDRDRLRETIESIDHERLKEQPVRPERIPKLAAERQTATPRTARRATRSAKEPNGGDMYTEQEMETMRSIYLEWENPFTSPRRRRELIATIAKQLGRSHGGIYNQLHKMKSGYKPKPNHTPTP